MKILDIASNALNTGIQDGKNAKDGQPLQPLSDRIGRILDDQDSDIDTIPDGPVATAAYVMGFTAGKLADADPPGGRRKTVPVRVKI